MTTEGIELPRQRFPLGRLLATPGLLEAVPLEEAMQALHRHACGDWGNLDPEDMARNALALQEGTRLLSAYASTAKVAFWIITEADRSATTILLPEEY